MRNYERIISNGFCITTLLFSLNFYSQEKMIDGGEPYFKKNDASNPCISVQEYELLDAEVAKNTALLGLDTTIQRNIITTSLQWPLRAATGFTDCGFHFIGAYVDQNTAASAIQDYNCETNTYDGHQGTDIAIWPFSFYKMDNNQVEVIAAAGGTIIQRADGNFDRNCTSNSMTANSIIIQHADGSYALYWHMKSGSVTSKLVGQTVIAGEYLGIVGSSGSSSGPHLHFEIRAGSASTTYKDPFSGACNTLNATSWWTSQRPHTDPALLKVSVNTTDIPASSCPNTEVSNESNSFAIPFQGAGLPAGYAKFYIFLREATVGTTVDLKILNPNGSTFTSWTYTVGTFYKVSYWGFSKVLPTIAGTYTFQAVYNGNTCSKAFTITTPLNTIDVSELTALQIYPNPTNDFFTVSWTTLDNGKYSFQLINEFGQILKNENILIENNTLRRNISISELSSGVYFLKIKNDAALVVKKIIKN